MHDSVACYDFFSLRHIKSNSKLKGNLTKSCFQRQRTGIPDAIVKSLLSMPDGCLTVKRNFPKILIHSHQLPPFVYQSVTGPFVKGVTIIDYYCNGGSENEGHLAHKYTLYNSFRSSTTLFLPKPIPEVFDWPEKYLSLRT